MSLPHRDEIERRKEALDPERRALFERWIRGHGLPATQPAPEPAVACTRAGDVPVSIAQEGWLAGERAGDRPAHTRNMPFALDVHGALDVPALEWSVNQIIAAHDALRCRFELASGRAVVEPAVQLAVEVADARSDAELDELALAFHRRPFDFATAPLLRVAVLRRGPTHSCIVIVAHHIVWDGWSLGLFLRELEQLYPARAAGGAPPLAARRSYAELARSQRAFLATDEARAELAYWREQLAGITTLDPPTDRPRPARRTWRGAHVTTRLGRAMTDALARVQRQHALTPFISLATAYMTWLAEVTGERDIAISTNVAGRLQPGDDEAIGDFTNVLVLRCRVDDPARFDREARAVGAIVGDALRHQRVPFGEVAAQLGLTTDPALARYYPSLLFHNFPAPTMRLGALDVAPVVIPTDVSVPNFLLVGFEHAGQLELSVQYNCDLYDASTAARYLAEIVATLERGVGSIL